MNSPYDRSGFDSSRGSWLSFLGRIWPFMLFLILATAGMWAVYMLFSPAGDEADVIAAVRNTGLSAPFIKAVPAKPVSQRIVQSPGPMRVGIISGHKEFDPGAVCDDGLTEVEVNLTIAQMVVANLRTEGIRTDLLDEFDARLDGYSGTALVSIHADSCDYFNDEATGFKIAGSMITDSSQLSSCVEESYREMTQLPYHANTLTQDMSDYHAFYDIAPGTPAIIIETGFMNLDRQLLTGTSDIPAKAISEGILCYINAVR